MSGSAGETFIWKQKLMDLRRQIQLALSQKITKQAFMLSTKWYNQLEGKVMESFAYQDPEHPIRVQPIDNCELV
jgi:hypothetical protein